MGQGRVVDSANVWVCIGGGKSLAQADVRFCRSQGWNLATVNMGYRIVPDCHLFHAMDRQWWDAYAEDAISTLSDACQIYTGQKHIAEQYGLNLITWDGEQGYSHKRDHCHGGKLSGIQLINIVGWQKPDLIILLGYDNLPGHWHGEYPAPMVSRGTIDQGSADYLKLWSKAPFSLVNCSRVIGIEGIPHMTLEDIPDAIQEARLPKAQGKAH